jgi:hypothetical protein
MIYANLRESADHVFCDAFPSPEPSAAAILVVRASSGRHPAAPGQPNQEVAMDQEALNLSIRKFLKHFGVTAQREIEQAVQRGLDNGTLRGHEAIPVRATLVLGGLLRDFSIDGEITLQAPDG